MLTQASLGKFAVTKTSQYLVLKMYTNCCIQTPVQFNTAKLCEATAADTNRAKIRIRSLSVTVAVPGVKTSARANPEGEGLGLGLGV